MKALIICNGEPLQKEGLISLAKSCDLVIAADGGANVALSNGLTPDVIIGDMDSFTSPHPESLKILYDPDQETNDLEKALEYALTNKIGNVIISGATGKRTDHALKNFSVQLKYATKFRSILMIDNMFQYEIIINQISQKVEKGTVISLFPLSGKVDGITTEGLKYSLKNESLENGVRDGSSNVAIANEIKISVDTGALLLMTERR